jgi:hypothetical protein
MPHKYIFYISARSCCRLKYFSKFWYSTVIWKMQFLKSPKSMCQTRVLISKEEQSLQLFENKVTYTVH